MKIEINHLAKTEGHASFKGALLDGQIAEAKVISDEGARLVEGILLGRNFADAPPAFAAFARWSTRLRLFRESNGLWMWK